MSVTIKGFASDWSVPEPAKASLAGTFAQLDEQGRQPVRKGELMLNAKDYGAVGDGVADDTAALQSFINAVVRVPGRGYGTVGYIPPGVYRITSKLNVPVRPGWSLRGAGMEVTQIIQATDNTPILDLGGATGSGMHTYDIGGFTLGYANAQPSTNINAIAILCSTMPYEGTWRAIRFTGGYYATKVASGVGAPWGHTFDDLVFSSGITGGAFDWSTSVNRVPNNRFGRLFVDAQNMVGTIFHVRGYNFEIDTIEVIAANKGARLFFLASGGMVNIGSMKVENGIYATGSRLWEFSVGCYARIGHLTVGGHTMQFNDGKTDIVYGASGTKIEIGMLELSPSATGSTANVHAFGGHINGDTVIDVGRVVFAPTGTGVVKGLTDIESNAVAGTTTVRDHVNGRLSNNRGDANVVIALGDPNKQLFNTAFTAPRTIDLPSDNFRLFNGLYYEFVFNGAINGTNTVTVQCGGTVKRVQATDKAVVGFTYRRNVPAAAGWVLTKYETLP